MKPACEVKCALPIQEKQCFKDRTTHRQEIRHHWFRNEATEISTTTIVWPKVPLSLLLGFRCASSCRRGLTVRGTVWLVSLLVIFFLKHIIRSFDQLNPYLVSKTRLYVISPHRHTHPIFAPLQIRRKILQDIVDPTENVHRLHLSACNA
ncbi:hypothetical protein F4679DRAFT_562888 [Xylaria curta]|nr:hypothetical protein F4679DRAFT_562888 [Xylaria curta]